MISHLELESLLGTKIQKLKIVDQAPHLVAWEAFRNDLKSFWVVFNSKAAEMACCSKSDLKIQSFPKLSQGIISLRKMFEGHTIVAVQQDKTKLFLKLQGKEAKVILLHQKPKFKFENVQNFQGNFPLPQPQIITFDLPKIQTWLQGTSSPKEVLQKKKKYEKILENIQKDLEKHSEYKKVYAQAIQAQNDENFDQSNLLFTKAKKLKQKYEGTLKRFEEFSKTNPENIELNPTVVEFQKSKIKSKFDVPYVEHENFVLLWGRSATENDRLSLKIAKPKDYWFHTRSGHSSHVILKMKNSQKSPPLEALLEAAKLCAKNSDQRNSKKVEVMYTLVKNLKKPKGLPPGKILYSQEKSLFVEL